MSARTVAKCDASRPQLFLFVSVSYLGRREETNMVIVNVKLLSGYVLEQSSLDLVSGSKNRPVATATVPDRADGCAFV